MTRQDRRSIFNTLLMIVLTVAAILRWVKHIETGEDIHLVITLLFITLGYLVHNGETT